MKTLGIYVPKPDSTLASMHPHGTGFVGAQRAEGHLLLHYEEPSNAVNVKTWEDRLNHAAGRLDTRYPTSKMCGADPSTVDLVGFVTYCEGVGWYIGMLTNEELVEAWAPGPHHVGGGPDFTQRAMMRNIQGK